MHQLISPLKRILIGVLGNISNFQVFHTLLHCAPHPYIVMRES